MILNITSNTFVQHDSGKVTSCTPLDFVLSINHSILSFYTLNSTLVKVIDFDYLWNIVEKGKTESHGIDTALSRPYTIVNVSGFRYDKYWQKKEVNFQVTLNHYGGLGVSEIINGIVNFIKIEIQNLNPVDLKFLNKIAKVENNGTQHFV